MMNNQRRGMSTVGDLLEDWMNKIEEEHREKDKPLPEPTKKGFADLRGRINKPLEAA